MGMSVFATFIFVLINKVQGGFQLWVVVGCFGVVKYFYTSLLACTHKISIYQQPLKILMPAMNSHTNVYPTEAIHRKIAAEVVDLKHLNTVFVCFCFLIVLWVFILLLSFIEERTSILSCHQKFLIIINSKTRVNCCYK